jgi:heme-degrading monooxygenase HmoA
MIKHLVMWRLKDQAQGQDRRRNALLIKQKLESLAGKIAGLIKIEVGLDISNTPDASDVALYCEFDSLEALAAYQEHPEHKATAALIKDIRVERRQVDYTSS